MKEKIKMKFMLSLMNYLLSFQTQRLHESGLLKEADLVRLNALQRSEEVRILAYHSVGIVCVIDKLLFNNFLL